MRIITLLSLLLLPLAGWAATENLSSSLWGDTITLRLLQNSSVRAAEAAKELGANAYTYDITYHGQKYSFASLSMDGYAKDVRATGGRFLHSVGLDFSCALGKDKGAFTYTHPLFLVYNAFLVFMIAIYWFSKVNKAAQGKTDLEIIPFIVKLAVGLIVSYNIPFVYSVAMTLKDLGLRVVTYAVSDSKDYQGNTQPSAVMQNLAFASGAPIQNSSAREIGISDSIKDAITRPINFPPITSITPTVDSSGNVKPVDEETRARNSGRRRLADLVADLNAKILDFQQRAIPVSITTDAGKASTDESVINVVPVDLGKTDKNLAMRQIIDFVGFSPGTDTLSLGVYGTEGLSRNDATSADKILSTVASDVDSAAALASRYAVRLNDFMRLQALSYQNDKEITIASSLFPNATFFRYSLDGSAYRSRAFPSGSNSASATKPLGSILLGADQSRGDQNATSSASDKQYSQDVQQEAGKFLSRFMFAGNASFDPVKSLPDEVSGGYKIPNNADDSVWWGTIKRLPGATASTIGEYASAPVTMLTNVFGWLTDIPRLIANCFIAITKWFWVPLITYVAQFFFNITIEAYSYILWLAYPFWFYEKTKKAFTGAVNTLISVSFTAATFSLLCLIFEALAGQVLHYACTVVGGTFLVSQAGLAIFTGGLSAGITLFAIFALGVGFSIFYMVGTFLCLRISPSVFKAFQEGTSVVAPMITAAGAAIVSGVAGGALAGLGVAAGGGALAGALGKSQVLGAAKKGLSNAASGVTQRIGRVAGPTLSSAASSTAGQFALKAAGKVASVAGKAGTAIKRARGAVTNNAVGRDVKSVAGAVRNKAQAIAKDPVSALANLGQSKFGQAFVAGAAGFSGDIGAPLKTLGATILATAVLNNQGQGGGSSVPSPRTRDSSGAKTLDAELKNNVVEVKPTPGSTPPAANINISGPGFTGAGAGSGSSGTSPGTGPDSSSSGKSTGGPGPDGSGKRPSDLK